MEFRILGPIEVATDHGSLALGGRQRRLLLAMLLCRPGVVCTVGAIADALWGDGPPPAATTVLHAQISRLRKLLEPERRPRSQASVLQSVGTGYRLELCEHTLDAERFRVGYDDGRELAAAGDPGAARSQLEAALSLWRGEPFDDLGTHPAIEATAAELSEKRTAAAELLFDVRMQLGEHVELVAELEAALRANPYRERIWGQLMLALYRCGRQADALAAYQRCREELADELGIDPSQELQSLEEAILLQKPELEWRLDVPVQQPIRQQRMTVMLRVDEAGRRSVDGFDSVLAAVDAVHAVPDTDRVALHTGAAVRMQGDWFGPAVEGAHKLSGLGHAGQVLVSDETAQEVRGTYALRDLGIHRLSGDTRLQRVYELPGAQEFPPLRGGEFTDLPVETNSFIGRERELAALRRELDQTRLLTLTGPGGSGKTRLALRLASGSRDSFAHGVLLVDLAPVEEPDRLLDLLSRSLQLSDEGGRSTIDTVTDYLADRSVLLLLDNCEHLVSAAAALASQLLGRCPLLRILVTSREQLGVAGETIWPVPALALPEDESSASEAVDLFVARARSAQPGFELDETTSADVATICRRLDGLPLAIELAAARIRTLSPAEIVERLGDRFTLLRTSARDVPARHQTLSATIAWSYEQLRPETRALLSRLAVFAGGFTLPAAEAIGGPAVLDHITELVDKSLLRVIAGGRSRYGMLESIRVYAAAQLARDPVTTHAAHSEHAAYMVNFTARAATALRGPNDLPWLVDLDAEYANILTAIHWTIEHDSESALRLCGALGDYWFGRGRYREGGDLTERALAAHPTDTASRAAALCTAALMAYVGAESERSAARATEALECARRHDDRRTEAIALQHLAYAAFGQGDFGAADSYANDLERLSEHATWVEAWAHITRAEIWRHSSDHAAAQRLQPRCVALAQSSGHRQAIIYALRQSAYLASYDGDHTAALRFLNAALDAAAEAGHTRQVVLCLTDISAQWHRHGDLEAAREAAMQSLRLAGDVGGGAQSFRVLLQLAEVDRAVGDTDLARLRIEALRASPNPALLNAALLLLGDIEFVEERYARARIAYAAAEGVGGDSARALATIGAAAARMAAGDALTDAELLSSRHRLQPTAGPEWDGWYLALAARYVSDVGMQRELLTDAVEAARGAADPLIEVRVFEQIAYLTGDRDVSTQAELLATATEMRDRIGMPRAPLELHWYGDRAPVAVPTADRAGMLTLAESLLGLDQSSQPCGSSTSQ